ncbi:MAG: hypothetical protein K0U47_09340 [Epsilonproteobacteria bacterium]|nr:hypothetical protein [Campylobacterota bacterium]
MKKLGLFTFLSIVTTTLCAQDVVQYEVAPIMGYNTFDSGSKMKNDAMYGIRGTVYINEFYGYRLSYERADDVSYDASSSKSKTDLSRVSGQLIVNGEKEYNIVPYILLGGGYEMLSDETSHDVSQGFMNAGLGFKYFMSSMFNLSLEAKALKKFDTDDIDYTMNLALGYMFGPSVRTPEPYQPSVLDEGTDNMRSHDDAFVSQEPKKDLVVEREVPIVEHIQTDEPVVAAAQIQDDIVVADEYTMAQAVSLGYYVQMAVWFDQQNPALIKRLERGGHPYAIKDAVRFSRDAKLVVVGPFESRNDAKVALRDLRRISRDAFITKIK